MGHGHSIQANQKTSPWRICYTDLEFDVHLVSNLKHWTTQSVGMASRIGFGKVVNRRNSVGSLMPTTFPSRQPDHWDWIGRTVTSAY